MRIRKRFRVLVLAAGAATIAVPVGLSLTLESGTPSRVAISAHGVSAGPYQSVVVPVSMSDSASPLLVPIQPPYAYPEGLPDAARLVLVGTVLVGAAAAVRKSS
jgi:hypothetical protein